MKRSIVMALFALGCVITPHLASAESPKALISAYAKQVGITEVEAKKNFEAMIATLRAEMIANKEITIQNFGKFHIEERSARTVRNPKTGQMLQIGARRYPRFSASDNFKKDMNPNAKAETKEVQALSQDLETTSAKNEPKKEAAGKAAA